MSATLIQSETEVKCTEVCRDPNSPDFKGYAIGCYWETREPDEGLWLVTRNDYILPMLDRYAIIPLEKYHALLAGPTKD